MIEITQFVFHKIVTRQGEAEVTTVPRKEPFTLPDSNVSFLVEGILDSFNGEASIAFAEIIRPSWFDTLTQNYVEAKPEGASEFYDYSIKLLEELQKKMKSQILSSGGYLTIVDYTAEADRHLLYVLIKDETGVGINDNMELEEVTSLSLDKLHFAANLDINSWSDPDGDRKNHICFLKGRNRTAEVVGYFKNFLHIDEDKYLDPAKHTRELVDVIKSFCENLDESTALSTRKILRDWIQEQTEKNAPVTLEAISNIISPEDPQLFVNHLRDSKVKIPPAFIATSKQLNSLIKYRAVGPKKQYTLSFEHDAIEDGLIFKNSNGNIEIKDAPEDILKSLPER